MLLGGTLGCLVCCLLSALVASSAIIVFSGSVLLVFDCLLLVSIDLFVVSGEHKTSGLEFNR